MLNFITDRASLLTLAERALPFTDKKSAMPALANARLVAASREHVGIDATDLYNGIRLAAAADVVSPGAVAVDGKDLFERVRSMQEGQIEVRMKSDIQVEVRQLKGSRRFLLSASPAGDQPTMPTLPSSAEFRTVPAALFADLIARTLHAVSTDETRPHINSLCVEWVGPFEGQKDGPAPLFRAIATDGHRLALCEQPFPACGSRRLLLPLGSVKRLRPLLDLAKNGKSGSTDIQIATDGKNVSFGVGDVTVTVKLIDAEFPPFDHVIPSVAERAVARVSRLALLEAMDAMSIAASDRTKQVVISFRQDRILLRAEAPETGDGHDEVPAEYTGPEIITGMNWRYMRDVLTAIETEQVAIAVGGELDPIRVDPVEMTSDGRFVTVLMPMKA